MLTNSWYAVKWYFTENNYLYVDNALWWCHCGGGTTKVVMIVLAECYDGLDEE